MLSQLLYHPLPRRLASFFCKTPRVERARGTAVPRHALIKRATERAFHLGCHRAQLSRHGIEPALRQKLAREKEFNLLAAGTRLTGFPQRPVQPHSQHSGDGYRSAALEPYPEAVPTPHSCRVNPAFSASWSLLLGKTPTQIPSLGLSRLNT